MIVEDETLAQQVIQSHLQKIDTCKLVAICNNALEAREVLNNEDVDLMFLDIQLPGMTGLHFLRSLTNPPLVVLTTAYSQYAVESYEFNIIDYLLKPISFERFSKTMDKLIDGRSLHLISKQKESSPATHIFIKSNGKFVKMNFSEITYIKGMKDYLKIHTTESRLVTHQTMNEMEKMLPVEQFVRVHKSFIVALAHIKSIYGNSIEIEDATIPVGITYKDKVMLLIK
jgi:DNA-binding LytR/AlgR family response regulator